MWIDGIHIYNRVNGNNDGFHFISSEYVHVTNCDVQSQDDACALFGSCRFVTVTNSTFSTRWSVFRFGGGDPENITISNCIIYETYGCPIKMQFGPESQVRNILFSNLVLQDVTGPISINLSNRARRNPACAEAAVAEGFPAEYRRSRASAASVVAEGAPVRRHDFPQNYRPGETRQCIVLNAIGDGFLEDIVLDDVHVTYGGGGTAEEAQARGSAGGRRVLRNRHAAGVRPVCPQRARADAPQRAVRSGEARPAAGGGAGPRDGRRASTASARRAIRRRNPCCGSSKPQDVLLTASARADAGRRVPRA